MAKSNKSAKSTTSGRKSDKPSNVREAKGSAKAKGKASSKPKANELSTRSAAVAATWSNKKVRAARAIKSRVKVNGEEYRSTEQAFEALKLPHSEMVGFRMELKAAGRKVYADGKHKYTFTIVS